MHCLGWCRIIHDPCSKRPTKIKSQVVVGGASLVVTAPKVPSELAGGILATGDEYIQLSNEKNPGWLGYIGYYTTQLYRDYNKQL